MWKLAILGWILGNDPSWTARFDVEFGEDQGTPVAAVTVVLIPDGKPSRETVEVSMSGGYPGGYGRFVQDFAALRPGAEEPSPSYVAQVADSDEGRFLVPVSERWSSRVPVPGRPRTRPGIGNRLGRNSRLFRRRSLLDRSIPVRGAGRRASRGHLSSARRPIGLDGL